MQSAIPYLLLAVLGLVLAIFMLVKTTRPQRLISKAKKEIEKAYNTKKVAWFTHVAGLPISQGSSCVVAMAADRIVVVRSGTTYELPYEKVLDICIKDESEIRRSYVSNAGTAAAGAMLFGPLGAIIGGQPEEIVHKTVRKYFIITFDTGEGATYISFNCSNSRDADSFVKFYHSIPKASRRVVF